MLRDVVASAACDPNNARNPMGAFIDQFEAIQRYISRRHYVVSLCAALCLTYKSQ